MYCRYCSRLSIARLVELAEIEFEAGTSSFPAHAYVHHHKSIHELMESAYGGCDMCQLIVDLFKHKTRHNELLVQNAQNLLSAAQSLAQSDIRLALSTDTIYAGTPVENVEMFDVLMIQAGPSLLWRQHDWSWDHKVRLILYVPREKPLYIKQYRIGRFQLDPQLGSAYNFSIGKGWLQECHQYHTDCPRPLVTRLPTRVIDVSSTQGCHLLISDQAGGHYAALSHCWGGPIETILTTQNEKIFQQSLPFESLPLNFRDAITITRELEIKYLWIDSLCIMQDSKADWQRESAKMASVYQNSIVTISALTSRGSKDGILGWDSQISEDRPMSLPLVANGDPNYDTVKVKKGVIWLSEEHLNELESEAPLTVRGWTLQESMLSPRQLCYGRRQIYWICSRSCQTAEGIPHGPLTHTVRFPTLTPHLTRHGNIGAEGGGSANLDQILADYYELVENYSARRLSYASDKLPAFSGLARRIHPLVGGDYLAGIWTTDWRNGLCWRKELRTCRHVRQPYRAPSWSWAVTDERVIYSLRDGQASDHTDVQLVRYDIKPLSELNQYGEIHSCQLVLTGLTMRLVRSTQTVHRSVIYSTRAEFDEPEDPGSPENDPDIVDLTFPDGKRCLLAVLRGGESTTDNQEIDPTQFSDIEYTALLIQGQVEPEDNVRLMDCLILRRMIRGVNEEVYERVGYFESTGSIDSTDDWKRRTVVLV